MLLMMYLVEFSVCFCELRFLDHCIMELQPPPSLRLRVRLAAGSHNYIDGFFTDIFTSKLA